MPHWDARATSVPTDGELWQGACLVVSSAASAVWLAAVRMISDAGTVPVRIEATTRRIFARRELEAGALALLREQLSENRQLLARETSRADHEASRAAAAEHAAAAAQHHVAQLQDDAA